jgi:hypothetical protein
MAEILISRNTNAKIQNKIIILMLIFEFMVIVSNFESRIFKTHFSFR